jgi:hypothetical protein
VGHRNIPRVVYGIERFCTREGEAFPFTWVEKRKVEVKRKYGIGIGGVSECEILWMWEDVDESWRLEPTPLISTFDLPFLGGVGHHTWWPRN